MVRVNVSLTSSTTRRHSADYLLVVVIHLGPGLGDLAQDVGVGQTRVFVAELLTDSILEFEVSRRRTLGGVEILDLLLALPFGLAAGVRVIVLE